MKFLRPLVVALLLGLTIGAAWIWWNIPARVDMTDYAPADSIVYLEFNSLPNVAAAIQQNDVWRAVGEVTQNTSSRPGSWWKTASRFGVGPATSVIFARAQVALVVLGLNTTEQDETLKVRPDAALIVETHTSYWRTKPVAMDAVKRLSTLAYSASTCTERSANGVDYIECSSAGSDRRIIAAVDGSLVVVGNSEKAVQSCLDVRRGARPSIRTDGELGNVRDSLTTENSLGFGYISPANSAKLFAQSAPVFFGKAPGDLEIERLLESSAAKILRGIAWTAIPSGGAIEDRYQFGLEPEVVTQLQPAFVVGDTSTDFSKLVPGNVESLTLYRSKTPVNAWTSLDVALAAKLETLPAVLLSTLLKSSLTVYGIGNPKGLLGSVTQPLLTLKPSAQGSVLVARVNDKERLKQSLDKDVDTEFLEGFEAAPKRESEFTALFKDNFVLLGKTEVVQQCLDALRQGQSISTDGKLGAELSNLTSSAAIVTFTDDEARLDTFIKMVLKINGQSLTDVQLDEIKKRIEGSRFSRTETSLSSSGIERRTRSAFGQFSNLTSILQSDTSR